MAFEIKPRKWNDVIGEWDGDLCQHRYTTEQEALEAHKPTIEFYGDV